MRTTVRMDDDLLRRAKEQAARTGRTLTQVLEDALRVTLARQPQSKKRSLIKLPTFKGGGGLRAELSLDDMSTIYAAMDEGKPLDKLR